MTSSSRAVVRPPKQASTHIPLSVLIAALGLALGSGCQGAASGAAPPVAEPAPDRPVAVRTVAVRAAPMRLETRYLGTVRSVRRATVTARIAGTVIELPVAEGSAVAEGAIVARLAAPDADARVERAQAEVRKAKAERDYLCDRAVKDRTLQDAGALPAAAADLGRKQCDSAREAVRAGEAQRRELDVAADRSTEPAPLTGRVLKWLVEPGEHVLPGRPLVLIGGGELELTVPLTESDVARGVGVDTAATVRVARGEPHPGVVTALAIQAQGAGRTVAATLPLPEPLAAAAYNGMAVDVALVVARDDHAVAVPQDALRQDPDGTVLFLVQGDHLERRRVQPGLSAGGWVAVTPAPPPTGRVVAGALEGLSDRQAIFAVGDLGGPR